MHVCIKNITNQLKLNYKIKLNFIQLIKIINCTKVFI